MKWFQSAVKSFKALRVLGVRPVGWYLVYQAGLRSGHYRRSTPSRGESHSLTLCPIWPLPPAERVVAVMGGAGQADLLKEAEEIIDGRVRLFGGPPVRLELAPPPPLQHWTDYELRRTPISAEDVKFLWEPARFGWVFTLGRAYHITRDERFAGVFWHFFEAFDRANPPNLGPNWVSAQEVALRLLALVFASAAFSASPQSTPARQVRLAQSVAEHACRIPPTLPYARAQQNNHQVSEALGLYTAGLVLPDHPLAPRWREIGWHELNHALQSQIEPNGTYAQHSTNYHRLMLQAALIADALRRQEGRAWPSLTLQRLQAASLWLRHLLDPSSGRVPNLGHNDGAHILPLASGGFSDYRPTIQACARAFGHPSLLPSGPWDELSLWLGLEIDPSSESSRASLHSSFSSLPRLDHPGEKGWASLRAEHYTSRPAHADQLHVEIWYEGENLAADPGTYRYNAPPPWDNALACTAVHNTVTVDDLDQMTRAGTFLWVDLAQARYTALTSQSIGAEQDGYRRLGILHHRELHGVKEGWVIQDHLLPVTSRNRPHRFTLHWLLPDWPFDRPDQHTLTLHGKTFSFTVRVAVSSPEQSARENPTFQLIRAGESLFGPPPLNPLFGWISPTYHLRLPALSLRLSLTAMAPVRFTTWFLIPDLPNPSARKPGKA